MISNKLSSLENICISKHVISFNNHPLSLSSFFFSTLWWKWCHSICACSSATSWWSALAKRRTISKKLPRVGGDFIALCTYTYVDLQVLYCIYNIKIITDFHTRNTTSWENQFASGSRLFSCFDCTTFRATAIFWETLQQERRRRAGGWAQRNRLNQTAKLRGEGGLRFIGFAWHSLASFGALFELFRLCWFFGRAWACMCMHVHANQFQVHVGI